MIIGAGCFDDSNDHSLMAGSLIHDSTQAPQCTENTNIDLQKLRVPSFSTEELSNPTTISCEAARAINHLQHQLGIDLEQEVPPVETANWDTAICTIQDHIINFQFSEDPQNILVEQQIQQYDAALNPNGVYTPDG